MTNSTQHHVHSHYTLADRKVRLYAVLAEISIWFGGALAISYVVGTVLLKNKDIGNFLGGIFMFLCMVVQIILMVNRSQTIGKYLFEIQVIDNKTGKRVGFWKYALLRTFVGKTLVIGAVPIIGLFFQPVYSLIDSLFIFRKDRRTLHDFIGGTSVIKLSEHQKAKSFFDFSQLS